MRSLNKISIAVLVAFTLLAGDVFAFQSLSTTPGDSGFQSAGAWMLSKDGSNTFDRSTDSLEAIRDRLEELMWTASGDDIYYTTGNVGIGITAPTSDLHIQGADPAITLDTATATDTDFWLGVVEDELGTDDDLFQIGDGNVVGTNPFLTIDTSGNVGIGTTGPDAKLTIVDGAILASGSTGGTPVSGAGTRMMWIPSKSAFRAGYVNGTQWDDANIGEYSVALGGGVGGGNIASGYASAAIGRANTAAGEANIALGYSNSVSGAYSVAIGDRNSASGGYGSTAIGLWTDSSAMNAIVIGGGVDNTNRLTNNISKSLMVGFDSTIPTLFVGPSSGAGTTGNVGIGITAPTAALHLKAGTANAGTAPLKLTSGTNLTTPEAGAIEFDGTNLYYTDSTATRKTFATGGSAAPLGAKYIVQTADDDLTAEQALGALATGILKNTTTTGELSIAAEGTDYYGVGGTDVAITDGGTGASNVIDGFDALSPLTTIGDTLYGGASGTGTRLAGNTTTTKNFLTQTGDGANSAAPAWGALAAGDIPDLSGTYQPLDAQLTDIAALAVTDSNIIVGDGTNWVAETGLTARTSLGAAASGANADITSTTALTSITRATGGAFNIALSTAAGDDFTVDTDKLVVEGDNGNVGIGTTVPSEALEVDGNFIQINGDYDDLDIARGIKFLDDRYPYWGVYSAASGAGHSMSSGTAVAGAGFSSIAVRFRVYDNPIYGFIFENHNEDLLASIRSDDGLAYFAGNVGIGTTAPDQLLHLYYGAGGGATVHATRDTFLMESDDHEYMSIITPTDKESGILFSDNVRARGYIIYDHGYADTDVMTFATAGAARMRLFASGGLGLGSDSYLSADPGAGAIIIEGNVGIGITAPTAQLHTKGNLSTALTGTVSVTISTTAVTGASTVFESELAVGDSIKIADEVFTVSAIASDTALTLDSAHSAGASVVTAYTDPNLFAIDNGDAVSKVVVDNSGNVGIGTADPRAALDVQYGTNAHTVLGHESENTGHDYIKVYYDESGDFGAVETWTAGTAYRDLALNRNGGNVGIGTTTPLAKLHVLGNTIKIETDGTTNPELVLKSGADNWTITSQESYQSGDLLFGIDTGGGNSYKSQLSQGGRLQLDGALQVDGSGDSYITGNVGIGTTSPTANFAVSKTTTNYLSDGFEDGTLDPFTTSGDANWATQGTTVHQGSYAAKAGTITSNQSTTLSLSVTLTDPATISFYYKVSSEQYFDALFFKVDGVVKQIFSGEVDWTQYSMYLASGSHTLTWVYVKDEATDFGSDTAWVDSMTIDYQTTSSLFAGQVGIGSLLSGTALNVDGDINTSGVYKINNTPVISLFENNAFIGQGIPTSFSGAGNAIFGSSAGSALTSGNFNSFFGNSSGTANTTGSGNSAFGDESLHMNIDGADNTAVGSLALYFNTAGYDNSALGSLALRSNTTGFYNTALGSWALYSNTTGSYNTALGQSAGYYNETGSKNTIVGYNAAGCGAGSSSNNSIFGYQAGCSITTGSNNLVLGYQTGNNLTTGSNNIIIGYDIDAVSVTGNNQLNIGNTIYGDLSNGNVGIGTTAPSSSLHVVAPDEETYIAEFTGNKASASVNTVFRHTGTASTDNQARLEFTLKTNAQTRTAFEYQTGFSNIADASRTSFVNFALVDNGSFGPKMTIKGNNVGIGTTDPTAVLHLKAGTATASTAPLKLTSGTNLTTPEAGAVEFDGTKLYYTNSSAARQTLMTNVVDDTTPDLGGELDAGAHSIGFTLQTATGDGTTTIDWRLGNKFKFTFGAQNDTLTFTAPTNPCSIQLILVQDGTGSRTATFPATVKWAGGTAPTLSTAASAVDIISCIYDGTNYFCAASLAFATPA